MNFRNSHLIKLNVDTISNRKLNCYSGIFLAILGVIYVVSGMTSVAPSLVIKENNCGDGERTGLCLYWDAKESISYFGQIQKLTNYNKYLVVKVAPILEDDKVKGDDVFAIDITFDYHYSVMEVIKPDNFRRLKDMESDDEFSKFEGLQKKYTTECDPSTLKCESFTLIYNPSIVAETNHKINIKWTKDQSTSNLISGFYLQITTGNPNFVTFMSALKIDTFVISAILLIVFWLKMKKISTTNQVIEQKIITNLSYLLLFYNDPFYAVILYKPSIINVFLTTICNITFFTYLLYFWLVLFERMYEENELKSCKTEQKWKKVLVGILFGCGIIGYTLSAMMYAFDPGFQIVESYTWIYNIFAVLIACSALIILFYIVLFMIRVFIQWPNLIIRHKVTFLFSIYFIVSSSLFFFSETASTYFESGQSAVLFTCSANFYVFGLQYMYSISSVGEKEIKEISSLRSLTNFEKVSTIDEDSELKSEERL